MANAVNFTECESDLNKKQSLKQCCSSLVNLLLTDKPVFPGDLTHSYLHSWRTPRSQPTDRPGTERRPSLAKAMTRSSGPWLTALGTRWIQLLTRRIFITGLIHARKKDPKQMRQRARRPWRGNVLGSFWETAILTPEKRSQGERQEAGSEKPPGGESEPRCTCDRGRWRGLSLQWRDLTDDSVSRCGPQSAGHCAASGSQLRARTCRGEHSGTDSGQRSRSP